DLRFYRRRHRPAHLDVLERLLPAPRRRDQRRDRARGGDGEEQGREEAAAVAAAEGQAQSKEDLRRRRAWLSAHGPCGRVSGKTRMACYRTRSRCGVLGP